MPGNNETDLAPRSFVSRSYTGSLAYRRQAQNWTFVPNSVQPQCSNCHFRYLLGVAYPALANFDDPLCDHLGHRVIALNQAQHFQRYSVGHHQLIYPLRIERNVLQHSVDRHESVRQFGTVQANRRKSTLGARNPSARQRRFFQQSAPAVTASVPHFGGCNPGELTQSSTWAAVSARRALLSMSSRARPSGMRAALLRVSLANAARRSFKEIACLKRRRTCMARSPV